MHPTASDTPAASSAHTLMPVNTCPGLAPIRRIIPADRLAHLIYRYANSTPAVRNNTVLNSISLPAFRTIASIPSDASA